MQQISSYNKQKLECEEASKMKFCIAVKEKDGQNISHMILDNEEGKCQ